jgi:hypothetical protein
MSDEDLAKIAGGTLDTVSCMSGLDARLEHFREMLDFRIRMQVQPSRKVREAIVKLAAECFVDEMRGASNVRISDGAQTK